MINYDIRDELNDLYDKPIVLFDNPAFDNSIIGVTDEGNVVYLFDKMVEEFAEDNACLTDDAIDFIEYNTVRSLPYASNYGVPPIIVYNLLSL